MAYSELNKEFGTMMKNKREQLCISREKLSELIGISTVYCRDIEIGKSCPNWKIWLKICEALDININYIIKTYIRPELDSTGQFLDIKF